MIRVCPRCRGLSQNTFLCQRCGVQTQESDSAGAQDVDQAVLPDAPNVAGGLLIGLLIAQGLTYSMRHLAAAVLLGEREPSVAATFWSGLEGTAIAQSIQGVAIFLAAIIAGAGQQRPLAIGAMLGALNGLLLVAFQVVFRQPIDALILFAQPIVHAALGAIGASVGGRIWQPAPGLPDIADPGEPESDLLSIVLPEQAELVEIEPFPWARILFGTIVAVGGTFAARWIRDFVVMAGGGTGHEMQSNFITWEISAVAQIVGGIIAGSNSRNGAVYGFWTGLLSAALIVLIPSIVPGRISGPEISEVSAWLLGSSLREGSPAAIVAQGIQALVFGFTGGWLGCLILPSRIVPRSLASSAR